MREYAVQRRLQIIGTNDWVISWILAHSCIEERVEYFLNFGAGSLCEHEARCDLARFVVKSRAVQIE